MTGVVVDPQASCADGVWELAPQFTLAREVDYVADRYATLEVVSERGVRCGAASDPGACEAAVAAPSGLLRHLITTEGDFVRGWSAADAPALLAPIDVPEEAIWLAVANGFGTGCGAQLFEQALDAGGGYLVVDPTGVKVRVQRGGATAMVSEPLPPVTTPCCEGRRPEGLRSQHRPATRFSLGERFAAMAHMEAASVPAFYAIAVELACHGAPAPLVRAAWSALRDELRHARVAAGLARRFGATPTPALVTPMPPRTLAAFARDNAIEGCVNETYAAARMRHQAACAEVPVICRALAPIADDEARHASLSWAIARWVTPKLPRATRARLHDAQEQAVAALDAQLETNDDAPELRAQAGLPDAEAAHALHRSLSQTLWRA